MLLCINGLAIDGGCEEAQNGRSGPSTGGTQSLEGQIKRPLLQVALACAGKANYWPYCAVNAAGAAKLAVAEIPPKSAIPPNQPQVIKWPSESRAIPLPQALTVWVAPVRSDHRNVAEV